MVAWVPLSFLFPSHPHFPSALLSPIMGLLTLLSFPALDSPEWTELFFPCAVFWLGLGMTYFLQKRRSA